MIKEEQRIKILEYLQREDKEGCYVDLCREKKGKEKLDADAAINCFFKRENRSVYTCSIDEILDTPLLDVLQVAEEEGIHIQTYKKLMDIVGEKGDPQQQFTLLKERCESLRNMGLRLSELFSFIMEPLRKFEEFQMELGSIYEKFRVESFTISEGMKNLFRELSEGIKFPSFNLNLNYDDFTEEGKEAVKRMIKNGWYFSRCLPFTFAELISVEDEKLDNMLYAFYDKESERIFSELIDSFPSRKNLLKKIQKAHQAGDYELSIPVMLAQSDGIAFELFGESLYSKVSVKENGERVSRPKVSNQSKISFREDSIFDILFFVQLNEVGLLNKSFEYNEEVTYFNRHAVLHGKRIDYARKENSLRCIAILNFLLEIKEYKVDKQK